MPPKVKITKEEIVNAALELMRRDGDAAINARNIASALGCSTQPVFSNFATMEALQEAVLTAAYDLYLGFLQREAETGKYPPYKAFGIAYIRFAGEERELFKRLFMCDRRGCDLSPKADFQASVEYIMENNDVTRETAELMHLEMWACVHGIATMHATSFLELDEELISRMQTDVYQGLRARHLTKEENA